MTQRFDPEQYLDVSITDDKMEAHLFFKKIAEDFECSAEQLESFCKSHNIVYGVKYEELNRIANNPKAFFVGKTLIAMGKHPTDGKDGRIQTNVNFDDSDKRPKELADGSVDYKDVVQLNNARKGQLIAQRIPPTDGIPGMTVTGEEVPGKKGKDVRFKIGKNVVVDPEHRAMYAAIDGLVTQTDKDKINVFPVYEVNGDVDYNTGNIDFVGTVVVRGNVLTGFRIKASGDIRVVGGVEGAELEAEGSIEITSGIIAGNKGHVRAGQNVKSSFIQDGNVVAGNDVIVSQSIMHSNIRAGKSIVCTGTKGLIVGGMLQAGERVTARTIGNSMSTATVIEVGVLPDLRNELTELRSKLRASADNMDKTDKALAMLDQLAAAGQLSPDRLAMRIKLNATKKQALQEQDEMRERILELEKMLEETHAAKVEVTKTIYGGAKIVIGRYTRFIKDPTDHVSFRLSEGEVTMIPYA